MTTLSLHEDVRLGKQAARHTPRDLKFSTYVDTEKVALELPRSFGFDHVLAPDAWGMLGNDNWGDCVFAGACHETEVLTGRGATYNKPAPFTDDQALAAYSAVTGFDPSKGAPGRNPTDQGTVVADAMSYRRHTGIADANGDVHKILAYLSLTPGDIQQVWQALYLFEAVGIGIEFPQSAMDQFNNGEPWQVVQGSQIEGGHYIPVLSRQGDDHAGRGLMRVVTWGRLQSVTDRFYRQYCDEAWCYVTEDAIKRNGTSNRGFDLATLQKDLAAL
jgi:hypothetical protein